MKRLLFVIILFLLVLSSCSKLESVGYDMGERLSATIFGKEIVVNEEDQALMIKEKQKEIICIAQAENQITENITLFYLGNYWFAKNYSFVDGVVDKSVSIRYRSGSKDGENVNFFYPANIFEDEYVKYSNQVISPNGMIKGDFTFKSSFILKKTTDSELLLNNTFFGKNIPSQTFKIVKITYKNCLIP